MPRGVPNESPLNPAEPCPVANWHNFSVTFKFCIANTFSEIEVNQAILENIKKLGVGVREVSICPHMR